MARTDMEKRSVSAIQFRNKTILTILDPPDEELEAALRQYAAHELTQASKLERLRTEFHLGIGSLVSISSFRFAD